MGNESTLTVSRIIDADPETLWEAMTDQAVMQKWFFATGDGGSATVENSPKVGGSFKIDMHSNEDTFSHEGVYKEMIPQKKMVFTWNSRFVTDTVVTITLQEVDGGTEVRLVHEFLPNKEMKENHTQGWKAILENLAGVAAAA